MLGTGDQLGADFLPGAIEIERGGIGDYRGLAHLHYVAGDPATVAGVWRAVYREDFGSGRGDFGLGILDFGLKTNSQAAVCHPESADRNPKSADRKRCPNPKSTARVIAVAVLSYPVPRSLARERSLGLGAARDAAKLRWLNGNLRTISRVIVHPQFRSLGIASRLVRRVLLDCDVRYVEAFAAMGKIVPFFEKAGMRCDEEGGTYFWMDRGRVQSSEGRG